jgi:glyoxylate reductase
VVSTAALPFDISPILGDVRLVAPESGDMTRAELLSAVAGAEGLITLLSVAVDQELMGAAPRLRVIANFAVGLDNVDVAAATRRGIAVTNTPDVLTEATADLAFGLLLCTARRLIEGDRLVRSGTWAGWAPGQLLGTDVAGATLGIIGMGRIGQAMARRARGFGMDILYTNPRPLAHAAVLERELGARAAGKDELFSRCDFVSLHCPLNPDTRHIINDRALAAMKPGAMLVNTARGGCVDEAALVRALDTGAIAGAGLDVFEGEPRVHPGLVASDRVALAPHIGSATTTARRRMAEICAHAVRAVLDGRQPPTLINPEVYS